MANILVVAAHPDDEVLGCGGTIARRAAMGDAVTIAILAQGAMSRAGKGDASSYRRQVKQLRKSSQRAASILGAGQVVHFDFPDNRMDGVDLLDIVKTVEQCVERYEPQVIYTHHVGDLNVDHIQVAKAVLTAARPLPRSRISEIYSFEVLSSSEWGAGPAGESFRPTCFVEVSSYLEKKLEALSVYETEISEFPHPRSPEVIRALASRRGSQAGLNAAEGFVLLRSIMR
jgi:LmbE family N-acetylglucosaminyl deacetylase